MHILALTTALLVPASPGPEGDGVTWSRDVLPIFQESCQGCHRDGEVAPMALLDYEDARPWARSIRKTVERREMPPWHADPEHGEFANDSRLSEEEISTIVRWVDAGAPEGDPDDAPPPREFVDGWNIGEPDAVFTMPAAFEVPAKGEVPYQYVLIPTGFEEDRWVSALEVRPGNPEVVHHIICFVRQRGQGRGSGGLWGAHLGGMAPGEGPDVFPEGCGKLVKAGASLLLQIHYTPNGEATKDRSYVGMVFSDEPLRQVHTRAAMNLTLAIPPGASDHEARSEHRFRRPASLLGLMPHMHLRGKDFRYDLVLPGGERRTLLSVPRWDFDWQHYYVLKEPIAVPGGARLECVAHYDNSKENPANPNPDALVRWGDQTDEEMMIGFLSYVDRAADEPALRYARPTPAGHVDGDEGTRGGTAGETGGARPAARERDAEDSPSEDSP